MQTHRLLRARRQTCAPTHKHAYLGVAIDGVAELGVGVHTESELHVGYLFRSVDPHLSYTLRFVQSARPALSNAEV
jgi:hypothetical protein